MLHLNYIFTSLSINLYGMVKGKKLFLKNEHSLV